MHRRIRNALLGRRLRVEQRPRAAERGAAFVEALIVISFLILAFMGLVFFREFYVKQLRATRLARAATITYAMTGCDDLEPKRWIGSKDLGTLQVGSPSSTNETSQPKGGTNQGTASTSQTEANSVLQKVPGISSGGDGFLNPITTGDVSGTTVTKTREGGLLTGTEKRFKADPRSRSFVTCSDKVRDGDFKDVVSYVLGIFNIKVF